MFLGNPFYGRCCQNTRLGCAQLPFTRAEAKRRACGTFVTEYHAIAMNSFSFCRSKKGKPKQFTSLVECNLLSFAQSHDTDPNNQLHYRINAWLKESRYASSKRREWGMRAWCICLEPQIVSDCDVPLPGLQNWLPRRNIDGGSESSSSY